MRAGRTASKLREVTNEVGLISVTALGGGERAALWRIQPLEHAERALKPSNASQPLRRDPDRLLELPFEMPRRHTHAGRKDVHADKALSPMDVVHGRTHMAINRTAVHTCREDLLNDLRRIVGASSSCTRVIQCAPE